MTHMKKFVILLAAPLLMISCMKTKGEVTLTYNKALAIYGDLDSLRSLPLLIPTQPLENPKSYFVSSDYVLVGELNKGIHIFDNLDMQNPQRVSFIQIPYNKEFYVKDNFLYAESLYDLVKIDISNIYNPVLVSRAENVFWTVHENDKGKQLLGFEREYVTAQFEVNSPEAKEIKKSGTLYYDYMDNLIQESEVPAVFTGSYEGVKGTMNRIAAEFGHVYVISTDKMYAFNNASDLQKTAEININSNTETIYATDDRIYLGSSTALTVYSAANPSNPWEISELLHTESCDPVLPNGNVVYYTLRAVEAEGCNNLGENTLNVVDVSNPNEMIVTNSYQLDSPYGMALIANKLLVGQGANGLIIFDANSGANNLTEIVNYPEIEAFDVMIHPLNSNIILVTNSTGIKQYHINWVTLTVNPLGDIHY